MTDHNEIERVMQVLRERAGLSGSGLGSGSGSVDLIRDIGTVDSPKSSTSNELNTRGYSVESLPEDNIPMLTEVVQVPRYNKPDLPDALDEVKWGALADRVEQNVMERILRRSEALLESQLKEDLNTVLERATSTLAADLHATLSQSIRDMVSRAVTDELTRLQTEISLGKR